MKLYVISWKDERWSADKKALKSLNELIAKNTPKRKNIFLRIYSKLVAPFYRRFL